MFNNISGINGENILSVNSAKKTNIETESFKDSLDEAIKNKEDEKLKEACVHFESYFLNMMFKSMRKTVVSSDGIFAKSNAEKIFQEMFDEETSKKMAGQGGIGLADMMYKQLSKENNNLDINV